MLIALLADIHANREAMSACLADAENAAVDRYVILGDLVGYGADPGWVVDRVAEMAEAGAVVLRGNHDASVIDPSEGMVAEAQVAINWTRSVLDDAQKALLAKLPLTVEEGDRLFVHASACALVLGPVVRPGGRRGLCRELGALRCILAVAKGHGGGT